MRYKFCELKLFTKVAVKYTAFASILVHSHTYMHIHLLTNLVLLPCRLDYSGTSLTIGTSNFVLINGVSSFMG